MIDILQIEGWLPTKRTESPTECTIEATYTTPATTCQKCGVIGGGLYKHGTKEVSFRDTPMFGKHVTIKGTIQRYRCRECNETFMPPRSGMDPDRRMTTRCVEWIQEQCMRDTFTRLAEYVGCVEGTVRNIAAERFERYNAGFKPYLPVWMGMDETRLNRRMRCVITDVGENQPMTGHERLMEALGNRCEACGGIFPGSEIHAHHISAEFTGTRPRRLYICEGCHRRFHTGPLTHGQQPST